jgi:hypothetical protein
MSSGRGSFRSTRRLPLPLLSATALISVADLLPGIHLKIKNINRHPTSPPFHVSGSLSEVKISLPFSPCPEPLSFRTKNSGPGRPKKGIKKDKNLHADHESGRIDGKRRKITPKSNRFFSTFHLFMFVIT